MSQPYLLIEQQAAGCFVRVLSGVFLFILLFGAVSCGRLTKLTQANAELSRRVATLEKQEPAVPAPTLVKEHKTQRTAKRVVVTTYQSKESQTDSTPHLNALNEPVGPGQCAVSVDLLREGWTFGRRIYLKGLGVYKISDVMNPRFRNRIDIWTGSAAEQDRHDGVLAVLIKE